MDKIEQALGVVAEAGELMRIGANGDAYEVMADEYTEALATLRAELAGMKADAERYRWLRNPPIVYPLPAWIACPNESPEHTVGPDWLAGEAADAAIDAAREVSP